MTGLPVLVVSGRPLGRLGLTELVLVPGASWQGATRSLRRPRRALRAPGYPDGFLDQERPDLFRGRAGPRWATGLL